MCLGDQTVPWLDYAYKNFYLNDSFQRTVRVTYNYGYPQQILIYCTQNLQKSEQEEPWDLKIAITRMPAETMSLHFPEEPWDLQIAINKMPAETMSLHFPEQPWDLKIAINRMPAETMSLHFPENI